MNKRERAMPVVVARRVLSETKKAVDKGNYAQALRDLDAVEWVLDELRAALHILRIYAGQEELPETPETVKHLEPLVAPMFVSQTLAERGGSGVE